MRGFGTRTKRKGRTLTNFSYSYRLKAEELETLERFTAEVPVKVGALADALGLRVVLATLPLNISGLIQPDDQGKFVIKINRFESKERQRFTIAHEIAHYLLHRDRIQAGIVDSVLYRSKLSSRIEAEANKLAADIVMPNAAVFEELKRRGGISKEIIVDDMAEKFQVSKQAMAIRVS